MRGRGLKRVWARKQAHTRKVAPHAGAWIETETTRQPGGLPLVAPHAGAWIETPEYEKGFAPYHVAPHAGAWIETLN